MFFSRIRIFLIVLFFVLGILLHYQTGFKNAWYLFAASIILLITHLLFGNVWAAFSKLKKGNLAEAEQLLKQIKRPDWLAKSHRAYYHFIKGMIALQQKDLSNGEIHLKEAIETGLRNDNDYALATLNLAHIYYVEKRLKDSRDFLQQAKSYNSDDPMIRQNLDKLEKALSFSQN